MGTFKIPLKAKMNARAAIYANSLQNNKCATLIGKRRAKQIISDENLSLTTLKRTYSYLSRAKAYDKKDWSKCGTISYNLWGGDAMLIALKKFFNK
jgi:hypothetical protein